MPPLHRPAVPKDDISDLVNAHWHPIHVAFHPGHTRKDVCWRSLPASLYRPGEHLLTVLTLEIARLIRRALRTVDGLRPVERVSR
ncbi:hypothetical protein FIBSPDRAFT_962798 [Athelia psychrophila]|uniref:Uncharacterized protein n=1 Tax=Athelia psychrophila TaxID=1759441 RepID=A0A165ZQ61_9AGAM|nr:hypothetical protein FIBSPDRAFT_962798 [Fibularhizoctonia sp. CBS 109695]